MKILQRKYTGNGWKNTEGAGLNPESADLVLAFACPRLLENTDIYEEIKKEHPKSDILLCSTAGEIYDTEVNEDSVSLTAIQFEKTSIKCVKVDVTQFSNSYDVGLNLVSQFDHRNLKYVLVISDGHHINGSKLVQGLRENLPEEIIVTGGLAGDGSRFNSTLVGLNEKPVENRVVAIGFYGSIVVNYGSMGGWSPFGPERLITKSKDNVLYELDNKPALDVYKLYLGEHSKDLPESGLRFPLSIRNDDKKSPVVRTILSVNEEEKSLTFAGNMPEGYYARLMTVNLDKLIEGSGIAAQNSIDTKKASPDLAILISCVGRKLVLHQRVEEEVEVVRAVYGDKTAISGFYSYGEISPAYGELINCELHNQTMTITTLTEE
jgi:hypothetical protein